MDDRLNSAARLLFVKLGSPPLNQAKMRVNHLLRQAAMQFDCGALCNPLCGGEAVPSDGLPSDGLCSVLRNTSAVMKHAAQLVLSACMPLCRCKAVESRSLGIVLRNTLAVIKHAAQVELSGCIPLCHCKAVGHGDTHEDSKFIHTNSHLASCQERNVRDVMRVRELRGDEFIAEKRRNHNVEQKHERMRGDIQRDCGLCGVSQARGLLRITSPTASMLWWPRQPPVRRRGGTIGWLLHCPAQHLGRDET